MAFLALPLWRVAGRPAVAPPLVRLLSAAAAGGVVAVVRVGAGSVRGNIELIKNRANRVIAISRDAPRALVLPLLPLVSGRRSPVVPVVTAQGPPAAVHAVGVAVLLAAVAPRAATPGRHRGAGVHRRQAGGSGGRQLLGSLPGLASALVQLVTEGVNVGLELGLIWLEERWRQ